MLMPAAPLPPAAMTAAIRCGVMPPTASTGSDVADATAVSAATPAADCPGLESVSNTVPKIR